MFQKITDRTMTLIPIDKKNAEKQTKNHRALIQAFFFKLKKYSSLFCFKLNLLGSENGLNNQTGSGMPTVVFHANRPIAGSFVF